MKNGLVLSFHVLGIHESTLSMEGWSQGVRVKMPTKTNMEKLILSNGIEKRVERYWF